MKEIDIELLKILNSKCDKREFIKIIQYLYKANVLNSIEEKICDTTLEQLEMTSFRDVMKALDKGGMNKPNIEDIKGYEQLELTQKVDDFILKKKKEENIRLLSLSLEESASKHISKEATDCFFNRYVDVINIQEDNVFELLEKAWEYNELDGIEVSTASESIDKIILGLKNGSITTIIGDKNLYKSLWAINIAYQAMESDKNVLYISLGTNKESVYKRFLVRHSRNVERFDNPISLEELNNNYNKDTYKPIYFDFKNDYLNKLIIFDEIEFDISTHHNLQKLITYAQMKFIQQRGKGIDLIIIDDFSYMKLDTGKRNISNKGIVANEYYKYLRNQAKGLLGTDKYIPILITMCCSDDGYGALNNEGNYLLHFVLDEIKSLSDNILTIYCDKFLRNAKKVKLQVIQSNCGEIMEEAISNEAECEYWYLKYNYEADIDTKERLKLIEEENEYLKTDNEQLSITNKELGNRFFQENSNANNMVQNSGNIDLSEFDIKLDFD